MFNTGTFFLLLGKYTGGSKWNDNIEKKGVWEQFLWVFYASQIFSGDPNEH